MKERPLSREESGELSALMTEALELLPLPPGAVVGGPESPPAMMVQAIATVVDMLRSEPEAARGAAPGEVAMRLGVAFGEELCRSAGWEWVMATPGGAPEETLAVAAPDRSDVIFPMHCLGRLILSPQQPNDLVLLFAVVSEARLPTVPPGSWRVLG